MRGWMEHSPAVRSRIAPLSILSRPSSSCPNTQSAADGRACVKQSLKKMIAVSTQLGLKSIFCLFAFCFCVATYCRRSCPGKPPVGCASDHECIGVTAMLLWPLTRPVLHTQTLAEFGIVVMKKIVTLPYPARAHTHTTTTTTTTPVTRR